MTAVYWLGVVLAGLCAVVGLLWLAGCSALEEDGEL